MPASDLITEGFRQNRGRLKSIAYRILGSSADADDAVQEAWVRLCRSGAAGIDNLGGWLTTVVARICLDMLRSRAVRREEPLAPAAEPVVSLEGGGDPDEEAVLADSVGLALLIVLDALTPPERLAFVLHDMFAMPFKEIAPIVGRSPAATRQLASRARRRVKGLSATSGVDRVGQRRLVDAFLVASREGNLDALLRVLDPEVVLRVDFGSLPPGGTREFRGPREAAAEAIRGAQRAAVVRPALVNGTAGLVSFDAAGLPFAVLGFVATDGRIVRVDVIANPARVAKLRLARHEPTG